MPNRPLLRSRLVWALAKRTLLASSSALLRSSAVRSGARLNINGSVYHRRERLGQSSSPPNLTSFTDAITPPLAVSPCLVPVAARLHGTPPAGSALGVVVVRPTAVLGGADLYPCPCPLRGGDDNVGEDPSQCRVRRRLSLRRPSHEQAGREVDGRLGFRHLGGRIDAGGGAPALRRRIGYRERAYDHRRNGRGWEGRAGSGIGRLEHLHGVRQRPRLGRGRGRRGRGQRI